MLAEDGGQQVIFQIQFVLCLFVCLFFQTLCLVGIAVSTFFFTLVWQFAQFILLLESMAFFGTYSLGFIPKYKVRTETGVTKLLELTRLNQLTKPFLAPYHYPGQILVETNWKLRLLQTFVDVLQKIICMIRVLILQFQKISMPPHGRLMEIPRQRGVSKAQFF